MSPTDVLLVAATLAVGTALALPAWNESSLHLRRDEALNSLRIVGELQDDFFSEHQRYSESFSELGFSLRGRRLNGSVQGDHYVFELTTWDRDGRPDGSYRVTATGDPDPRDQILDIIIIESEPAVEGETPNATTPVILSDDISKTLAHVASLSAGAATGFRGDIAGEE